MTMLINFNGLDKIKVIHCNGNKINKIIYFKYLEEIILDYGDISMSNKYNIKDVIHFKTKNIVLIYFNKISLYRIPKFTRQITHF